MAPPKGNYSSHKAGANLSRRPAGNTPQAVMAKDLFPGSIVNVRLDGGTKD
jgi:hypothetical protein